MKSLRQTRKAPWGYLALGMLLMSAAAWGQTPAPTLTGISQNSVTTPTAAFTFTATGTNFVSGRHHTVVATEEFGSLPTTVNSATQLTVSIPPIPPIKQAIVVHLYVRNPGGARSDKSTDQTFTVNPPTPLPAPTLASISQNSVTTPSAAFTFTATGTNFVQGTNERGRDHTVIASEEYGPLPTTVNSATQLTIHIPELPAVQKQIVLHLFVRNPGGSRSDKSTDQAFTINPPAPVPPPTLASISQNSVTTPSAAFTVTVTGTNFVQGEDRYHTVVDTEEYGPLWTTVNSSTQLTVHVPELLAVQNQIVVHLFVRNPDGSRSDKSTDLTFTINPPAK